MTHAAANTGSPAPIPFAINVFGADEAGKPHASAFKGKEAELAEKAAGLTNMRVLKVADDAQRELATQLPVGRVFASGKAFVHFVKKPLYDQLCALGGHPAGAERPRTPRKAAANAAPPARGPGGAAVDLPLHWSAIGVGSLVLATTGVAYEGWFEAAVVEAKGDDLFALRWRDWEDEPLFLRRRNQLGLLPLTDAVKA